MGGRRPCVIQAIRYHPNPNPNKLTLTTTIAITLHAGATEFLIAQLRKFLFVGAKRECVFKVDVLGPIIPPDKFGMCSSVSSDKALLDYFVHPFTADVSLVRVCPKPQADGHSWVLPFHSYRS